MSVSIEPDPALARAGNAAAPGRQEGDGAGRHGVERAAPATPRSSPTPGTHPPVWIFWLSLAPRLLLSAAGLAAFFLAWHWGAKYLNKPLLLPGPLDVYASLKELYASGFLYKDTVASLKRVFTGYLIAVALAVPLALVVATSRPFRFFALPVLSILRPIPPIAWIPLAILWFGIGDKPSFFITALAAFFPIFLNALAGGLAVDGHHIFAARCLGAGKLSIVRHVVWPSALPQIWTGLKIGLGQSWMAVVTSELIAAQSGLGYMIQVNRLNLETPAVLAGMLLIGTLGALMAGALALVERWVLPWQTLTRKES